MGREALERRLAENFFTMPRCRCEVSLLIGRSGDGVAESRSQRITLRYGVVALEIGVEAMRILEENRKRHQRSALSAFALLLGLHTTLRTWCSLSACRNSRKRPQ